MNSTLVCQNEERRNDVRHAELKGLDYIEVSDDQLTLSVFFLGKAPKNLVDMPEPKQIKHVAVTGGRRPGYRAPEDIQVTGVQFKISPSDETDDYMIVSVNKPGDFSDYTLKIVEEFHNEKGVRHHRTYPGFDSRYSQIDFSFKVGCPSDLDCKPRDICPPSLRNEPEINYLAKDFDSFRQLILDRLALIMPDWKERHEADIGVTLVELLAYAGDYLSYHQDAVATEAYLDTARQRISVRRHVQLVDYQLHEGNNARAWVFVELKGNESETYKSDEFFFITGYPSAPQLGETLNRDDLRPVPPSDYLAFEPLVEGYSKKLANSRESGKPITFYEAHNEIPVYTWGDTECCIPKGATSATLRDEWVVAASHPQSQAEQIHIQQQQQQQPLAEDRPRRLKLSAGDFLLLEEVIGPQTHNAADADLAHRQVVRLTKVTPLVDELYGPNGQPVLEVEWDDADALSFPLCISTVGPPPKCEMRDNISVARGNIVLTDHGRTIDYEPLGLVPIEENKTICFGDGRTSDVSTTPGRFRPTLKYGPITSTEPIAEGASASQLTSQNSRKAVPCIRLCSTPATRDGRSMCRPSDINDPSELILQLRICDQYAARCLVASFSTNLRKLLKSKSKDDPTSDEEVKKVSAELRQLYSDWEPQQSLLNSRALDTHFVAETDNDGRTLLRFGDDELGRQPQAGSEFSARYRVGNGPAGNVGSGAIRYMVFRDKTNSGITLTPRNPLPATGGTQPESVAEAKQFAPHAFRRFLTRAITPNDYSHIVERDFGDKVQRAAASLRWTGSSYEVLVAVDALDRFSDEPDLDQLLQQIYAHLYKFRRIGHDVSVKPARRVPLDIAMTVCVHREYMRGDVKAALLNVFSSRINPDGSRGYFHPDNLSFGDGIRLSQLVAAAQAVIGVENVVITKLQRLFEGPADEIDVGILTLGPLEIARLDNDASFPENGKIQFDMQGGR